MSRALRNSFRNRKTGSKQRRSNKPPACSVPPQAFSNSCAARCRSGESADAAGRLARTCRISRSPTPCVRARCAQHSRRFRRGASACRSSPRTAPEWRCASGIRQRSSGSPCRESGSRRLKSPERGRQRPFRVHRAAGNPAYSTICRDDLEGHGKARRKKIRKIRSFLQNIQYFLSGLWYNRF